jgi:hypothetical protein
MSVHVFDEPGRVIDTLGRRGKGPGEFLTISALGLVGDTLWVWDAAALRLTFLPRGGEAEVSKDVAYRTLSGMRMPTLFADRSVLINAASEAESRLAPHPNRFQRFTPDGKLLANLASFECTDEIMIAAQDATIADLSPLQSCPIVAVDHTGNHLVVVHRKPAASRENASFVVSKLRSDGSTLWTSRIRYEPREITSGYLDTLLPPRMYVPEVRAAHRNRLSGLKFAPPVRSVRVGHDGTIFLGRELGDSLVRWMVLDPRGKLRGELFLDYRTEILKGDAKHIWVIDAEGDAGPAVVRVAFGDWKLAS